MIIIICILVNAITLLFIFCREDLKKIFSGRQRIGIPPLPEIQNESIIGKSNYTMRQYGSKREDYRSIENNEDKALNFVTEPKETPFPVAEPDDEEYDEREEEELPLEEEEMVFEEEPGTATGASFDEMQAAIKYINSLSKSDTDFRNPGIDEMIEDGKEEVSKLIDKYNMTEETPEVAEAVKQFDINQYLSHEKN